MKTNHNNTNEAATAIDVSALIYTNIQYDVTFEDVYNHVYDDVDVELDNKELCEAQAKLHDSLPKIVKVNIDEEDRYLVLEAINNKELQSLCEVWDWFSDETGWCVCDATVTTIDGKYSE